MRNNNTIHWGINNDDKTYYLKYLLLNQNLFKDIFLFNYISCTKDSIIEILHKYFIKNILEDKNLIKKYLEIMLATDVFRYVYKMILREIILKCLLQ